MLMGQGWEQSWESRIHPSRSTEIPQTLHPAWDAKVTALLGALICQAGQSKAIESGGAWEGAGLGGRMWGGSVTPVKQKPTTTPAR